MSTTAGTYNWKEAASGNFTDPARWAEGSVPGALDTAQFNVEGTYSVSFDTTVTNKEFNIKQGNVTFLLNGSTYRTLNNGTPKIGAQDGDIAALTVTGGVFHVTPQYYLYLASNTSTRTLNIVGADTTCIIDPPNYGIRCYSNATLSVTGAQSCGTVDFI